MRTPTRGFTLVELLASIGVIALSLAICLPVPEESLCETVVEDDGPVTVRVYACNSGDRELAVVETDVREAILGTHLEFCAVDLLNDGTGEALVAVWSPADSSPDADLAQLREVLGDGWNVRHSVSEEESLVASNS